MTTEAIETEIDNLSGKLAEAERLKEYKATLEALLQKANSAVEDYPATKYAILLKRWQDQDQGLGDLVDKVKCTMPNWKALLHDAVAPLFATIADLKADLRLAPERPEPPADAYDGLYARRERQQLILAHRQAEYDQARLALAAWEKPAPTLEKILNDNDKLAADIKKALGQPAAPALLYDLFFKLLPLHCLVAPPAVQSPCADARQYVTDAAGEAAWGELIDTLGPQPMLVEPAHYLATITGAPLAEYNAAKAALADAAGALQKTLDEIKRAEKSLDEKRKALEKTARAALLDAAAASVLAPAAKQAQPVA